jgi:hypothetical protein
METVTMDFAFPVMKEIYGTFLVTLYRHFEDANVEDARSFYPYEKDTAIVSVEVPHDVAMLLKLQFGGNMRKRPDAEMENLSMMKLEILKARNIEKKYNFEYEFKKNLNEGLIIKNNNVWK